MHLAGARGKGFFECLGEITWVLVVGQHRLLVAAEAASSKSRLEVEAAAASAAFISDLSQPPSARLFTIFPASLSLAV